MRSIIAAILVACLAFSCSAGNIARRGEYIDRDAIQPGASRASVLARFGAPLDTATRDGLTTDVFRVQQGEATSSKILKATGTTLLGIVTWGLSEIVADPITQETEHIVFKIEYDAQNRVTTVEFLK